MSGRRLTVAVLVMLAAGPAAAGSAQATLTVRATVVRSIAVRSVAVRSTDEAGVGGASRSGIETTVRGGDRDVRWAETRSERTGADGKREVLVTVWADGAPPAVAFRSSR
jgi:hypothetical protein